MLIGPFTYYKSADNTRAFLVADVSDPEIHPTVKDEGRVVLIEWGKDRHHPIYYNLRGFIEEIKANRLILFTPKL